MSELLEIDLETEAEVQPAAEREPHRRTRRRVIIVTIAVASLLIGGGSVGYWQGWLGFLGVSWLDRSVDTRKLDGYENEIDRAVELIGKGESSEAQKILSGVLKRAPGHVLANYNLGVIAHFDVRLQDAVQYYSTALGGAPLFRSALYNRGLANRDLGETRQAIADLSAVVANYPDAAPAVYNLGKLLIEQGDLEKGSALLTRAKRLDPTFGN
jgi:tetratricopeptide (TPR) repeat protein